MDELEPASADTPFWRFSVGFYSQPGVAPACLQLQDADGVDVNVLMYLLWSASRGRIIAAPEVAAIDARVSGWRDTAVVPLRTVRRALKSEPPLLAPAVAERFRNRIKAVELEAERLQQEAMYAFDDSVRVTRAESPGAAARANLAAYQSACGRTFAAAPVEAVLAAFDAFVQRADAGDPQRETA